MMIENFKQLDRLQNAKASFDVTKWDKQEKNRQKLMNNLKQYPEAPVPINEFVRKPPMSKRTTKRQQSVDPRGSPRGNYHGGKLPPMPNYSRG